MEFPGLPLFKSGWLIPGARNSPERHPCWDCGITLPRCRADLVRVCDILWPGRTLLHGKYLLNRLAFRTFLDIAWIFSCYMTRMSFSGNWYNHETKTPIMHRGATYAHSSAIRETCRRSVHGQSGIAGVWASCILHCRCELNKEREDMNYPLLYSLRATHSCYIKCQIRSF
jgi:hypothetical protein